MRREQRVRFLQNAHMLTPLVRFSFIASAAHSSIVFGLVCGRFRRLTVLTVFENISDFGAITVAVASWLGKTNFDIPAWPSVSASQATNQEKSSNSPVERLFEQVLMRLQRGCFLPLRKNDFTACFQHFGDNFIRFNCQGERVLR